MLIGDSFVWGMSANPVFNSFADNLLSKEYLVYNFGIAGTDPAQYEAIVQKYLPIIKPNIVVVAFYPGNDFMAFKREVKADEPLEHYTSVGFLESNPIGKYLTAEEAINFYDSMNKIPSTNKFNILCSKLNVTTKLWLLLHNVGITSHPNRKKYFKSRNTSSLNKVENTLPYIEGIRNTTQLYNTKLIEVIIPEKKFMLSKNKNFGKRILNEEALKILFGEELNFPQNLNLNDYETDGAHFNNIGSYKYANYLDSLITKTLAK